MAVVLLTGMSGAGTSTVLVALARLGHPVVDTDVGGWTVDDGEPLWHEGRMTGLLDAQSGGHLLLGSTVANQGAFYPRLDAVVLLERVATRTTNDFGRTAVERERIAQDTASVEPLLRRGATAVIDTRRPLADVVAAVLGVAGD